MGIYIIGVNFNAINAINLKVITCNFFYEN